MMMERQVPPSLLFKYINKNVYDRFVSKGNIRFGISTYYRSQYESGAGFADVLDGVRSASFTLIGQNARTANKHFLFCFSRSYAYPTHRLWLERKDCEYELCLVFNGRAIVTALANAVKKKIGSRIMACGLCIYGDHCNQVNELRGNIFEDAFLKPKSYSIEDEYRLAVSPEKEDHEEALDVFVPDILSTVQHIIRLDSP